MTGTAESGSGELSGRPWSRRSVLRTGLITGAVLAGGALTVGPAFGATRAPARGPAAVTVSLDRDWIFCGEYTGTGTAENFADTRFEKVTLPHSVVPLSWRNWKASDWEKVWLYRKHFSGPFPPGWRVFADFDGTMVNATLTCNGRQVATHQGGYLPWTAELTGTVHNGDNVLAVVLDSRWSAVPPEGAPGGAASIDYLEPGGIYRDVTLRVVPSVFISDVFAKPVNVLSPHRTVEVLATVDAAHPGTGTLRVELSDDGHVLSTASAPVTVTSAGQVTVPMTLSDLARIGYWSPESPKLYTVTATLTFGPGDTHVYNTRIGFRDARFAVDGFYLNGAKYKIFGLNRHQIYPYAGLAMSGRVQRRDAQILRDDFNCNMVRCSHYPQSPHFLDACDELGLMVWEEPPGWQYVGDAAWQDLVVANVHDMVLRDRNRPSVILWGIRLNETLNYPDLYARTRQVADQLDGSRQTSGAMDRHSTEGWAADVFAFDDYRTDAQGNATLLPPIPGVPYLVTEAVGALDGPPYYRWTDSQDVLAKQAVLHATVHDIARSDDRYAGLLGWAGFDYDSYNGHIFEDVKWPGVADTFRVPKFGAAFYQSQVPPSVRPVIQPAFFWDFGPTSPPDGPGANAVIATNCDRLELYVDNAHVGTVLPDRTRFPHLAHPLAFADLTVPGAGRLPELRIDGYVGQDLVLSRLMSSDPSTDQLSLVVDDPVLRADGSDTTRVVFRALDVYGNQRPRPSGDVTLSITGPGTLVGDNPFAFADYGGVGAVWVRSQPDRPGVVRLTARHPTLGSASVQVTML